MGDLAPRPLDQATGLRRLFEKKTTALIAFASTRRGASIEPIALTPGGRDKSGNSSGNIHGNTHVNDHIRLMLQVIGDFVAAGNRVVVIDEHPAPGGIAHAYGIESRRDMKHVLSGDFPLQDVMFTPAAGVTVIPAPRVASMELDVADEASLAGNLTLLKSCSDYVLIDCVHRSRQVLSPLARRADRLVVTLTPSGEDLTRSYALIKRVTRDNAAIAISVIVAHAASAAHANSTFEKLRSVARDHLGIHVRYQGALMTPGAARPSWTSRLAQPADALALAQVQKTGGTSGNDLFAPLPLSHSML